MPRQLLFATVLVSALFPLHGYAEGTLLGARGAYARSLAEHGENHFGAGLSVERSVIHHLLEAELVAKYLPTEHGATVPLELLAKYPFHPTEWAQPYLGLGPVLALAFEPEGSSTHFGGVAVVGTYFWFTHGFGLMVEANYELLYDHGLVQELGASTGLAWSF